MRINLSSIPKARLVRNPVSGVFIKERWVPIDGYRGLYAISNYGRIYSFPRKSTGGGLLANRLLGGYHRAQLCKAGKKQYIFVHRLVAIAFVSNPKNKPYVNHKDGKKSRNIKINLEWCTRLENAEHATRVIKTYRTGENHVYSLITDKQVRAIRKRVGAGESQTKLAKELGVSRQHINNVWKDRSRMSGTNGAKPPIKHILPKLRAK